MTRKKAILPGQVESISSPVNPATLYTSRSLHAIDASYRIMLRSNWRGEGTPRQFFVILVPSEKFLVVCPAPVFGAFLAELQAGTADKTQIPEMERELTDRVQEASLDRFGRLPLPPEFLAKAGIEKQGMLVGRFSKFEVWARDKFQAPQLSASLAQRLEII